MPEVKDIIVINIDGKEIPVKDTSAEVQELVKLYNKFNHRAGDIQDDLTMAVAAREQVATQINIQLNKEGEEKKRAAMAANNAPAEEATPSEPAPEFSLDVDPPVEEK